MEYSVSRFANTGIDCLPKMEFFKLQYLYNLCKEDLEQKPGKAPSGKIPKRYR